MPGWLIPALVALSFGLLTWVELRRPLRTTRHRKLPRVARNFTLAGLAAVPSVLQALALVPLLAWLEDHRVGLLHFAGARTWLAFVLAMLLLDVTLWIWHWLNHTVPLLWRFHLVHHADQDMDASTALRFHFGEIALSIPFRFAQVTLIGVTAPALAAWNAVLLVSILFHHANVRLPIGVERRLVWLVVTPRMHGIHHSTVRSERNTNYSSILSLWDRLLGTLLLAVPQREVSIGVPPLADERHATLRRMTVLPFGRDGRAGLVEASGSPRLTAARTRMVP